MITVKWTGAAGLEFTFKEQTILIDPYISRPSKKDIFFGKVRPNVNLIDTYLKELPGELRATIVSHTHLDHVLDIPEIAKRYDGLLIGNRCLDTLLRMNEQFDRSIICKGVKKIEISPDASITMIPSKHGLIAFGKVPYPGEIIPGKLPMKANQYKHGDVFIPKLVIGGICFMQLGTANYIEPEIEGHECDVLFICIPGWKKVPGYTNRLLDIIKPKIVVPFHFDDFSSRLPKSKIAKSLPLQDIAGFVKRMKKTLPMVEIKVPDTYETLTF